MSELSITDALRYGQDYAEKQGATETEGFGINYKDIELEIEKGRPQVSNGTNYGVSFRVVHSNNIGFAFSTRLTREAIEKTIDQAIGLAKVRGPDKIEVHLPSVAKAVTTISNDPSMATLTAEDIGDFYDDLKQPCEESRFNFLGGQIMYLNAELQIQNSLGVDVQTNAGLIGGGVFMLSTKGLIPSWGFEFEGSRWKDRIDWRSVAERTIETVKRGEAPRTINYSGETTVILEPDALGGMFGGLFSVLSNMLKGDNAFNGESYYADRLGEEIANPLVTLHDNGLHPDGIFSASYDMEGVPSTNLPLIEKGVLKNYLLDTHYARKMDAESNGKSTRSWFGNPIKSAPSIGTTNLELYPGDSSYEEMVAETREGFSITSVMGVHMSDFASGRFSVTGNGHYIKNGEIKYPVQDISVSGTIPQLLKGIDMVGREQKHGFGSFMPHIRVQSLTIAAQKMPLSMRSLLFLLKVLTTLRIKKNPFVAD